MHVGSGHDGYLLLSRALQACNTFESGCVREKLAQSALPSGMNGPITIDAEGNNAIKSVVEIRKLEHGSYILAGYAP